MGAPAAPVSEVEIASMQSAPSDAYSPPITAGTKISRIPHKECDYIDGLSEAGIPEATLRMMAADNAARLLGLKG